jgi:hypothetical protein
MTTYRDVLFFIPAGLAIFFMIWVLFKFTQQLAGPSKSTRRAAAESRYLRVVPQDSQKDRASAHD